MCSLYLVDVVSTLAVRIMTVITENSRPKRCVVKHLKPFPMLHATDKQDKPGMLVIQEKENLGSSFLSSYNVPLQQVDAFIQPLAMCV